MKTSYKLITAAVAFAPVAVLAQDPTSSVAGAVQ